MILLEEGSQRALMRNLQKEQERERRRIRDRQRRQSMSVEERERHLARRRRNYQLRRQRAENARLGPRFDHQTAAAAATTATLTTFSTDINEYPPMISVSNVNVNVPCNDGLISGRNNSVGLEIPAYKLAKLPKRLRLNHLKHLARSLDDPVEIPSNHVISFDLIIKGNETSNSTCVLPKGLRLNRVKRLARSFYSDLEKALGENHQRRTEVEQNLPVGELQRQLLSMTTNMPKVDHRCGNE